MFDLEQIASFLKFPHLYNGNAYKCDLQISLLRELNEQIPTKSIQQILGPLYLRHCAGMKDTKIFTEHLPHLNK